MAGPFGGPFGIDGTNCCSSGGGGTATLCVPVVVPCGATPNQSSLFYKITASVRFQGPSGEDVTRVTYGPDTATCHLIKAGNYLAATVDHNGSGYIQPPLNFPYAPNATWAGGTLTGGATPAPSDYPQATIAVSSDGNGSVTGITLSGGAASWATVPTLTIDPPITPTYHPTVCLSGLAAGTWTITASHPCYGSPVSTTATALANRTVNTPTLTLARPWTLIHYSDAYGSATTDKSIFCYNSLPIPTYTYASTEAVALVTCPTDSEVLAHQPDTIEVSIQARVIADDDGWLIEVERSVPARRVAEQCGDPVRFWSKASPQFLSIYGASDCVLRLLGSVRVPCGSPVDADVPLQFQLYGPCSGWEATDANDMTELPASAHITAS